MVGKSLFISLASYYIFMYDMVWDPLYYRITSNFSRFDNFLIGVTLIIKKNMKKTGEYLCDITKWFFAIFLYEF